MDKTTCNHGNPFKRERPPLNGVNETVAVERLTAGF